MVRSNQVQSWWDIRDTFGTRFFGEHFPPSVATARMYQFELCVKGFDVSAMTSYYHKGYQRQDEGFYLGDLNWSVLKNGFSWKPPPSKRKMRFDQMTGVFNHFLLTFGSSKRKIVWLIKPYCTTQSTKSVLLFFWDIQDFWWGVKSHFSMDKPSVSSCVAYLRGFVKNNG